MTCQEALRLLYEVIDKEASQIDSEKVKEHLNNCRDCLARYEFEQMFRTFVVNKASTRAKSEQLKHRILAHINDHGERPTRFFNKYKRRIFAAAAILVIFIAVGLSAAQYYRHQIFVYPFEKSHLDEIFTGDPTPVNAEDIADVKNFLTENMRLSLSEDIPGYKLVHSGYDEIVGKKFVHLQFLNGQSRISLFIGNPADIKLPGFEKVNLSGIEYFRHICAGCQVIYWKKGNSIAIAVSEDKTVQLPALISALEPI